MSSGKSYAVVDLETTGLDCWSDLITEIGLMVVTPDAQLRAESVLVKIDRRLPDNIVRLTGITDQLLALEGIPIDDALLWLKNRIGDLPLVGHNVIRFDRGFLLEATRQHRRTMFPEDRAMDEVDDLPAYRFIDTMALFKGYKLCLEPSPGESHYQYPTISIPNESCKPQRGGSASAWVMRVTMWGFERLEIRPTAPQTTQ